jgi:flagellar biosynthesis protein FlhF
LKIAQQIEYEAQSDAEAIQVARDRLGREAVILSSRPVKVGGVLGFFKRSALWVTAGILVPDQEDAKKESRDRMVAFQHLLEVRRAVGGTIPAEPEARAHVLSSASAFSSAAATTPAAAALQAYETGKLSSSQDAPVMKDVGEIKEILGRVLTRLENGSGASGTPDGIFESEDVRKLTDVDVDRNIAVDIVTEFGGSGLQIPFQTWLPEIVNTLGTEPSSAIGGRKILFAGPTGVGKTTTIAKIAASQSLWGNRKVVLMTADTYRIAAVEQLRTYAKILGIPIEIVADPGDIPNLLKKHRDADLILMDTAGRSHYDNGRLDELRALYDSFLPDAVHLVMASNIKYRDMLNVIERMGVVPISALIFTKLDETYSYGTILNIIRDFGIPVSFFTAGQNVPNDIEVARGDRFVDLLFNNAVLRQTRS